MQIVLITQVLSGKGTQKLGDFEIKYVCDPKAKEVLKKYVSFSTISFFILSKFFHQPYNETQHYKS